MEKIKISVSKTEYFVKPSKGRVKCKLTYTIKGAPKVLDVIDDLGYMNDIDLTHYGEYEAVGVALVDPKDNFDVNVGKQVARAKAESAAYRSVYGKLVKVQNRFNEANKFMEEFNDKATRVVHHNIKYLSGF